MVFTVAASAARRRAGMMAKQQVQRRSMGGHAPAPEWEGIDKVVRGYFPGDHQLAIAIMGGYTGLFILSKIGGAIGGKKKKEEPAPVVASSAPVEGAGIPSVDTPEFDKFVESDAFEKLLGSDEQLAKLIEG